MGLNYFTGFETGTIAEGLLVTGNCTVSSTLKRSGAYSLKIVGDGASANWVDIRPYDVTDGSIDGDCSATNLYTTVWVRFQAQTSDPTTILRVFSLTGFAKATLKRNLDGSLALLNKDGTLVATGATKTGIGLWYKIYLRTGCSSADGVADGPYELKINGITEFSGTTYLLSSQNSHLRVGNITATDNFTFYFDDLVLSNTAYLENYKIDKLVPNADGTYNGAGWAASAGNRWECVDETPASDTDRIKNVSGAATPNRYTANLTAGSTIGLTASIPIYAVKYQVRSNNSDVVGHGQTLIGRSGTTNSETGTSGGPPTGGVYRNFGMMWTTDPATSAPWTLAAVDAFEVGITLQANYTSDTHHCSQIIAEVLFAEAEGGQVLDCLILGNHIADGSNSGILIDAVVGVLGSNKLSGLSIIGNVVRDNVWDGIGLPFPMGTNAQAAPDRSMICGNVVCRNNQKGISLDGGYAAANYLDYVGINHNVCSDDPRSSGQQDTGIWIQTKMRYVVAIGNVAVGNAWATAITNGSVFTTLVQVAHNMTDD